MTLFFIESKKRVQVEREIALTIKMKPQLYLIVKLCVLYDFPLSNSTQLMLSPRNKNKLGNARVIFLRFIME